MKNIEIFKPKDFMTLPIGSTSDLIANRSNEILSRLLESSPVVYSCKDANGELFEWSKDNYPGVEFKARLICIEEIKKEPCKHEQKDMMSNEFPLGSKTYHNICKHCGIKIKHTTVWEPE